MNKDDLQTQQIQKKLLEILVYFQEFCKENNLHFVLAGGTCLGAVRHKGFIPWDDDVDVFMLRSDYEKLPKIWAEKADTSRYSCVRSDEKINIHHSATEIKDNNTTFINRHSIDVDMHQGLMIDVIPLDGVPENKLSRLHQMLQSMLYCCFNFQRLPNHKSKLTFYATKLALAVIRSSKLRYMIWKTAEKQVVKYGTKNHSLVASFGEGVAIMLQRFPKEWFLKPGFADFEGYRMPVPANVDEYLRISYGDYMKLPPEEEQVCRHDAVFIDLEHSYLQYRGIKYLVPKK